MLISLKVAKKYMHVYYFHEKHITCWDLRVMLETDNLTLGRRIVNRREMLKRFLLVKLHFESVRAYKGFLVKLHFESVHAYKGRTIIFLFGVGVGLLLS